MFPKDISLVPHFILVLTIQECFKIARSLFVSCFRPYKNQRFKPLSQCNRITSKLTTHGSFAEWVSPNSSKRTTVVLQQRSETTQHAWSKSFPSTTTSRGPKGEWPSQSWKDVLLRSWADYASQKRHPSEKADSDSAERKKEHQKQRRFMMGDWRNHNREWTRFGLQTVDAPRYESEASPPRTGQTTRDARTTSLPSFRSDGSLLHANESIHWMLDHC